jgi:hypothetical protein
MARKKKCRKKTCKRKQKGGMMRSATTAVANIKCSVNNFISDWMKAENPTIKSEPESEPEKESKSEPDYYWKTNIDEISFEQYNESKNSSSVSIVSIKSFNTRINNLLNEMMSLPTSTHTDKFTILERSTLYYMDYTEEIEAQDEGDDEPEPKPEPMGSDSTDDEPESEPMGSDSTDDEPESEPMGSDSIDDESESEPIDSDSTDDKSESEPIDIDSTDDEPEPEPMGSDSTDDEPEPEPMGSDPGSSPQTRKSRQTRKTNQDLLLKYGKLLFNIYQIYKNIPINVIHDEDQWPEVQADLNNLRKNMKKFKEYVNIDLVIQKSSAINFKVSQHDKLHNYIAFRDIFVRNPTDINLLSSSQRVDIITGKKFINTFWEINDNIKPPLKNLTADKGTLAIDVINNWSDQNKSANTKCVESSSDFRTQNECSYYDNIQEDTTIPIPRNILDTVCSRSIDKLLCKNNVCYGTGISIPTKTTAYKKTLKDDDLKEYCLALGKNCEHLLAIDQQARYIGMIFFQNILYYDPWPSEVKKLLESVNIKRSKLFKYIYAESCAIFNSVKSNSRMIKVKKNSDDDNLSFSLDVDIYENIIKVVIGGNRVPPLPDTNVKNPRNSNSLTNLQTSNKNFKSGGINYINIINSSKSNIIDTINNHLQELTQLYNDPKLVPQYSNKDIFEIVNMCCITAKYVELGFTSKSETTCDVPFLKYYGLYWFKKLYEISGLEWNKDNVVDFLISKREIYKKKIKKRKIQKCKPLGPTSQLPTLATSATATDSSDLEPEPEPVPADTPVSTPVPAAPAAPDSAAASASPAAPQQAPSRQQTPQQPQSESMLSSFTKALSDAYHSTFGQYDSAAPAHLRYNLDSAAPAAPDSAAASSPPVPSNVSSVFDWLEDSSVNVNEVSDWYMLSSKDRSKLFRTGCVNLIYYDESCRKKGLDCIVQIKKTKQCLKRTNQNLQHTSSNKRSKPNQPNQIGRGKPKKKTKKKKKKRKTLKIKRKDLKTKP